MSTVQDRFNLQTQLEQLQQKYVGTGHADTTKLYVHGVMIWRLVEAWCLLVSMGYSQWSFVSSEWALNQHRDTIAHHLGRPSMLMYMGAAENESMGRISFNLYEKMLQPCGLPPEKEKPNHWEINCIFVNILLLYAIVVWSLLSSAVHLHLWTGTLQEQPSLD